MDSYLIGDELIIHIIDANGKRLRYVDEYEGYFMHLSNINSVEIHNVRLLAVTRKTKLIQKAWRKYILTKKAIRIQRFVKDILWRPNGKLYLKLKKINKKHYNAIC